MTYRSVLSGLLVTFAFCLVTWADEPTEPPVRLQKKNRPTAEAPPKEDAPKAEEPKAKQPEPPPKGKIDDDPPPEPDMDEQEVLSRVARNMKSSEDRLANRELNEGTRQVQRDIVDDLDKLIGKMSQPNNGGGGGSSSASSGGQKQKGGQQSASSGRRSQQKQGKGQMAQQGKGQSGTGQQQSNNNPSAGNNPGAGNGGPQGENKIPDIYKDIWGHLPESLRQEMMAYSREEYMAKYKDVIKQYYSTIAEKGRKKE